MHNGYNEKPEPTTNNPKLINSNHVTITYTTPMPHLKINKKEEAILHKKNSINSAKK
jgi:hypothetical protein